MKNKIVLSLTLSLTVGSMALGMKNDQSPLTTEKDTAPVNFPEKVPTTTQESSSDEKKEEHKKFAHYVFCKHRHDPAYWVK